MIGSLNDEIDIFLSSLTGLEESSFNQIKERYSSTVTDDLSKGHLTTNVCMIAASQLKKNPKDLADDLAEKLGVSRHQLSEFINQNLGCSFNELINKYRVESVKKDLLDKTKSHLSITGLAQESGFKSQASFYRIFKNHTGQTPSEFIANNS